MTIIKDKELVAKRLAEIAQANNGSLTPDLVVKDASNLDSPLHELFEWDDGIAGHKYRIEQARQVITSVRVVITTEHKAVSTVYYVRDPNAEPTEQGYVSLDKLRSNSDLARESIVMEFSRAASYLQRARVHAEALGMAEDVDALIADVQKFKEEIKV
jgi:hypothetical protein